MKKLITLLFLLSSMKIFAQTNLDSIVLVKVNDYRISLGLTKVEFDNICYKSAENQASYLFKNDSIIGHNQNNIGLETIGKRYMYFGGNESASIAEVCNSVNTNLKVNNDMYLDNLAKLILDAWKISFEHNKILIDPKYKFSGVSTKVKTEDTGVNNWTHYDIKSTMVFTNIK